VTKALVILPQIVAVGKMVYIMLIHFSASENMK
jgi:hypothetical protein